MGNYILLSGQNSPLRQRLTAILANQGWLVAVADDMNDLQRKVAAHGDPALLISLPDIVHAAAETATELRQRTRSLALIVAGIQEEDAQAPHLWQQFDDFAVWPDQAADANKEAELIMRVRNLLRQQPSTLALLRQGGAAATGCGWMAMQLAIEAHWHARLTSTEQRIAAKLADADGQVVPIDELAKCVSGNTREDRFNTLRVHITRLRRKLELNPAQLGSVVTVRGVGYRLDQPSAAQAPPGHADV